MNIWLVEPYHAGSHRAWADGYQAHSRHSIHLLTLPGRFWRWRVQGGALLFNSAYHLEAFFDELPCVLKHFPDHNELWAVDALHAKSQVLPLSLDLARLDPHRPAEPTIGRPLILWNHRWEYDKDPQTFFRAVHALADGDDATASGQDFGLLLLGRSYRNQPEEFLEARDRWPDRIVHFGYATDVATYSRRPWQADIVVSTARHDFFGAAVVKACYCDCFPVLPRDLAYPALIPAAHHAACLYDDFEGLLARLRWAIAHVQSVRAFSRHEHVAQFDWRRLAPVYDARMEEVHRARTQGDSQHVRPFSDILGDTE